MPRLFAAAAWPAIAALSLWLAAGGLQAAQGQSPPAPVAPEASPPSAPPVEATAAAPRAIDPVDLSAYVDGLVDAAMQRDHIAGVTVAIVDRQGPLLLRGYGIAAQAPRREVDPRATMFRIGSVSKTFTYLLGLKLVDAGRLDLDAPANDYLPADLQLPDDGYAPVLLRHLFTHTAGFEDSAMGHLFVDRAEKVLSIRDYLQRHRPTRVREPGTHAVYSNYSVTLLGALLAHVEGVDFDTLVERELLAPLGMRDTTFREPLAEGDPRKAGPAFEGRWSEGFKRSGGGFKPQDFEHIAHAGPAGGAASTAQDMGRYMRMLLGGGELDGVRVLPVSAYARLAGEPLFRNAPEVGGFSYGFFHRRVGKVDLLGHGGATLWFHSAMEVAPELGVGIFVSTNTDTGRRFAGNFPEQVLERYFAQARSGGAPALPEGFDASRFAGRYNSARSNYSSVEKIFLASTVSVSTAKDDSLVVTANGESTRWVPEGALAFREAEGPGRIAFFEDGQGRIVGFANARGHVVYDRVGVFDVGDTLLSVFAAIAVVAVLVLSGAWLRRHRRIRDQPRARFSALWLYGTALLWLLVLAVVGVYMLQSSDGTAAFYAYPGPLLTLAVWLALPLILASAICLPLLWPAWQARDWGVWRKLRHTLAVAAFALGAWLLWHWNLVGWKL